MDLILLCLDEIVDGGYAVFLLYIQYLRDYHSVFVVSFCEILHRTCVKNQSPTALENGKSQTHLFFICAVLSSRLMRMLSLKRWQVTVWMLGRHCLSRYLVSLFWILPLSISFIRREKEELSTKTNYANKMDSVLLPIFYPFSFCRQ